jgi:predicted transcriptional regulator
MPSDLRQITMTLPPDLEEQLEATAGSMHRSREAIIIDALRAHLPPLPPDLADEFAAWDAASDEAWLTFERDLKDEAGHNLGLVA